MGAAGGDVTDALGALEACERAEEHAQDVHVDAVAGGPARPVEAHVEVAGAVKCRASGARAGCRRRRLMRGRGLQPRGWGPRHGLDEHVPGLAAGAQPRGREGDGRGLREGEEVEVHVQRDGADAGGEGQQESMPKVFPAKRRARRRVSSRPLMVSSRWMFSSAALHSASTAPTLHTSEPAKLVVVGVHL